jgi:hypothetical protein
MPACFGLPLQDDMQPAVVADNASDESAVSHQVDCSYSKHKARRRTRGRGRSGQLNNATDTTSLPPNSQHSASSLGSLTSVSTRATDDTSDCPSSAAILNHMSLVESTRCESEAIKSVGTRAYVELATLDTKWGIASQLDQDPDRCDRIIAQIKSCESDKQCIIRWLLPASKSLAFSKHGCRVIQEALEFATIGDQNLLVNELKGHLVALYKSPWGNHVVLKIIEKMTPGRLGFVIEELSGKAVDVARHQYGCRVMERIIEHFPADQTLDLVREIFAQAEPLCRHPYANFVMQHLFEHGARFCKDVIVQQILGALPQLAKHRIASNVIQKAIQYTDGKAQQDIVDVFLNANGEDSLVEIGCTRYGSFVVRQLLTMQCYKKAVHQKLSPDFARLAQSQYGKRALGGFGIVDECTELSSTV